jgi:hypothetical protein
MTDLNPFDAVVGDGQTPSDNPFDAVVGGPDPAPLAVNPFEDAIRQNDERRSRQQFLEVMRNSKDVDPARQAKAIDVAKARGVPVGVAYQYLEDLTPQERVDYDSMVHKAPATARLLADPVKGPVAFPDAKPLGDIEEQLKAFSVKRGLDKPPAPVSVIDQMFGTGASLLTPEQQAAEQAKRISEAKAAADAATQTQKQAEQQAADIAAAPTGPDVPNMGGNYPVPAMVGARVAQGRAQAAQEAITYAEKNPVTQKASAAYLNTALRTLAGWGSSAAAGVSALADSLDSMAPVGSPQLNDKGRSPVTEYLATFPDYWAQLFPEDKGRSPDVSMRAAEAIASGIPFIVGGIGMKAINQSPAWFAAIMGGLQQAGQGEMDAVNNGAGVATKNVATWLNFLLGTSEAIPVEALFATAAAGRRGLVQFLTDTAANAGIEAGQNVAQQVPADLFARATYDPKRDVLGNAAEALKMGAIAGGFFGAVASLAGSMAEKNHDKIMALGDAVKNLKLADIAPRILDEHIAQLKKNGAAPEQVTAPAEAVETLFQEMGPEMAGQFPKTAQSLVEARTTGVEVTIPTEELVRLGKLSGYKTFAADVRIGDEMTLNEVQQLRTDVEGYLSKADTAATPQEDNTIFKGLRDQLVKAGQSQEVSTAQARLMDAFFQAQSERTGVPAADLARRYGLEVANSALDPKAMPNATTLQQDTSTPEFRNWFGDSKVVDDSGAPLVVYHGTNQDFTSFDASRNGQNTRAASSIAFFFTEQPTEANEYADMAGRTQVADAVNVEKQIEQVKKKLAAAERKQDWDAVERLTTEWEDLELGGINAPPSGQNIVPVYLNIRNPMTLDMGGRFDAHKVRDAIAEAKAKGHDGLTLTNVYDPVGDRPEGFTTTQHVAFDPTQIKSVNNRGTFDPQDPNILYQSEEPTVEGQSQQPGNKHGLAPYLRVETGVKIPKGKKPLFAQTTMNSTAKRQIAAIDEVLGRHPNATASVENWNAMMADALASADAPLPPYAFIKNINGDGSQKLLAQLSPGQIADADHGFANAAMFRNSYTSGRINITSTGKLFLWSFLSRGVSPYTQESLFIDSFAGIDQWIKAAADGTLKDRLPEYEAWAKSAAPQGSGQPGAGATHNLNAFGKLFLLKMSEDAGDGTGRSRLKVLHDMMTDPNSTGREIRRKFLEMGEGVGIDNKVVSFTLLVAGFTDVMVLDRVQIRELWNDGRFDGINLYDGYKIDGKPVAGSALSNLTYGARGLLIYEAIEAGLKAKVGELYQALGRPEAASPGRYHWETWVASSNQEASHATIDAILADAHGANVPLDGVTAKEGEYGAYAYGARYGRDGLGKPYFLYTVPGVGDFRFSVESFREFLGQIQVRANGVIPGKFKVTESGNGPWFNRPEVSLPKLGELAARIGERYDAGRLSDADAANGIDPPIPDRPAADQPGAPPEGAKTRVTTEGPSPGPSSSQGPTTLNQDVRGSITISPLRDKFRITLTEKANLSTFIHEGGHFFLEVLQDLVARGEASAQQVADLKTLKRWMAIDDAKQIDRGGHEKFARSWEQFIMEGKAPSLALHGIFQKFKAWMIFVYKRLANVRGDLNDEIRSVMDRLVASDAAIAEARALVGWRGQPMSQEETGLTDAEYKAYVGEWIKANDAQSADADARIMLEAARELKKTWTDEKIKVTKEVEKELEQTRGWKAWKLLETGEGLQDVRPGWSDMKIDPDSIPKEWRRDTKGMTAAPHEGGLPLDMVAEILDFDSGEQMLQAIGGAKLARKATPIRVRQIMVERHGEMDAAALSQEAMKAVHNTPTMDVLLTEFRALAAKANLKVGKDTKRMLTIAAEERVAQLTQRQLDPSKWRRAEVKAAEEAGKLAAKGRDMEAALAKRRQLMAAAMAKASLDAQDRISSIKDYLATFTTNRRRAALGKAGESYLDAVDQILEGIQFKEVNLKAITARKTLAELVAEADAAGEPVFVSDKTRDLLNRKNYSELTLEELEGVHDAVKNLWTIAKDVTSVRRGQEKIALEQALADITTETDATLPERKQRDHLNPGRIDKMMNGLSRYHAGNLKAEFILDWLGKTAGDLVYRPIAEAAYQSWKTHRDLTAPFMEKIRSLSREQKRRWGTKRSFMNLPMPVTGANMWMAALNLGNEGNKAKLLQGYGWTEAQLMAELNQFMTKEDWDLAQETWDTIDKMWPEIERIVKKATGLSPPRVEATPIVTPHGTYRGGYFPVVYDTQLDERMDNKLDSAISPEEMFSKRFTAFVINNGFTKGRTANTGKLLLSPDVISDHLGEVIHYVTHYEAVKQADKIIRAPEFKRLVKTRLGDAVYSELRQWLKDVATNTTRSDRQAKAGDAAFRWLRISSQLTALGLNVKSALKQPLGVATALDALGPVNWAHGIQKAWLSPSVAQNWRYAFANSKELGPLLKSYDRDLAAINRAFSDSIGSRAKEGAYIAAFVPISVMQTVTNVAVWHGAYLQATKQGMSEQEAFAFADKTVRTTQGSGALKDLSGLQRGNEANKFFTMFYSYFGVLYNRLADVQVRERGAKNLHRKAVRYTVLLLLPELLNTAFDQGWDKMFPPDKKREEDATPFIVRLALNTISSTLNTLPVVRDVAAAAQAAAFGGKARMPPGVGAIEKATRGGQQLIDVVFGGGDLTRSRARNIAALAGMVTGTPVYGIYRTIDDLFGQKMFDE